MNDLRKSPTGLKPCPFCGQEGSAEVTITERTVRCRNAACGASVSTDITVAKRYDAIARWNRRV